MVEGEEGAGVCLVSFHLMLEMLYCRVKKRCRQRLGCACGILEGEERSVTKTTKLLILASCA